jgi:hypothetical protein
LAWARWRRLWISVSDRGRNFYSKLFCLFLAALPVLLNVPFICFLHNLQMKKIKAITIPLHDLSEYHQRMTSLLKTPA